MVFVQVFGLAIALLWQSQNGIVSLLWRGVPVITRHYYLLLRSE